MRRVDDVRERGAAAEAVGELLRVNVCAERLRPEEHRRHAPRARAAEHARGGRAVRNRLKQTRQFGQQPTRELGGAFKAADVHGRAVSGDAIAVGHVRARANAAATAARVARGRRGGAVRGRSFASATDCVRPPDEECGEAGDAEPEARVSVRRAVDRAYRHALRPAAQVCRERLVRWRKRLAVAAPRRVRLEDPRAVLVGADGVELIRVQTRDRRARAVQLRAGCRRAERQEAGHLDPPPAHHHAAVPSWPSNSFGRHDGGLAAA